MATQIVKSFQSEGGFSVKEETIIDENRHVIDAASVKGSRWSKHKNI